MRYVLLQKGDNANEKDFIIIRVYYLWDFNDF